MKADLKAKVLETKRNLILERVAGIFEARGFGGVKMQEIAAALGISVGALYKLFPSKDALYYAYVAYEIDRFRERLLHECPEGEAWGPRRCLERYVALKFETLSAKRKAIEDPVLGDPLFFMKMNTAQEDPARPIFDYLADLFARIRRLHPLREADDRKLAYIFNSHTTGYVEYWIHFGEGLDTDPREVVDRFLEGVIRR
ncbi:TetR/AcrR family transcriptional regulator [Nitratifractor sp.]